jgi:hypothetical protein
MSEAERGRARVEVVPLVVRIGDLDCEILGLVVIGVSDKGRLPVVVQVRVGNGHSVAAVSDIEETIIVVLVVVAVRGEVERVDPDAVGSLDTNGVTSFG